ncbi:G-protein beta WD-40 repeats containing protein [Reticulomyxa filosa]|uniref:G-protein beta WD-40 repeats containing protein n=1 Tax=Reticulomyxa filosa TaxID=46433 RepID=X6PCR6_RETFI|nr:G-protein beta WD-40 repeats containing protein [Reticulomyxa filosa]|eukprot:ETO35859.1 G-protein beta WD-40 repeats containing protein [Reticulomyxa filosa]
MEIRDYFVIYLQNISKSVNFNVNTVPNKKNLNNEFLNINIINSTYVFWNGHKANAEMDTTINEKGNTTQQLVSLSFITSSTFDVTMNVVIHLEKQVTLVIQNWLWLENIKFGWIDDFDKMIVKYVKLFVFFFFDFYKKKNDNKIVSSLSDQTVRIWDIESGKQIQMFEGSSDWNHFAAFSPDGKYIVSGSRDGMMLWDVSLEKEVVRFEGYTSIVACVSFSPDGKYIVTGSSMEMILWSVESGKKIGNFFGHYAGILSVEFSSDCQTIVSASKDKTICLWNVKSSERLKQFKGHWRGVRRATFSPNNQFILSISGDSTIRIWDVQSGKQLKVLHGNTEEMYDVQYFLDGQTIVYSDDKAIVLWDLESGEKIQELKGHSDDISKIDFGFGDKHKHNIQFNAFFFLISSNLKYSFFLEIKFEISLYE